MDVRRSSDAIVGRQLAGYRIEALIGRGGMGAVYRAEETELGRKVALKVIAPELAEDDRFRERFLRESRIAASLDAENGDLAFAGAERARVVESSLERATRALRRHGAAP